MASLDLVNVQKSYGPVKILHDISIDMRDGEFLVLVGPSGCGKSTLMNIIAGLEEPSGGSLRLEGRDITNVAPADRNISMVFQSYALYPNMTVAKNIEFPLQMRKVDKAQRVERVAQVSKLLQIEHLLQRKPRQLSGGRPGALTLDLQISDRPRVQIELPAMPAALDDYIGQEVIAGIRAEAISLARDGMVAGPTQRFVNARIEVIEPTGADTLIVINLGGHEFTARLDPDVSLTPGQDASFLVDLTKLVCFDA